MIVDYSEIIGEELLLTQLFDDPVYGHCSQVEMYKMCNEWLRNNPRPDVSFIEYIASQFDVEKEC